MRKYLLALLSAVCIACAAFAFGCTKPAEEPDYFKVEYNDKQAGITFVFDDVLYDLDGEPEPFASGAFVRKGILLQFALEVDENIYTPEELEVTANSQVLIKDENGKYSFTVNEDTVIYVQSTITEKIVELCKGSKKSATDVPADRIKYFDENGNEFENEIITTADRLKFSLKVSSYYRLQKGYDRVRVTANTRIVTPDEDGFYTVELDGDTVIEVQGYEDDESFATRPDGGSGTKNDPFILKTPMDLFQMAGIINNDYSSGQWTSAYFELAEDIDLDGEQLFVVGDAVMAHSYFSGSFDGKGHTISNFYIEDSVVDQESFTTIDLVQVGMFGFVRSEIKTDGLHVPVIKNVNLKDYTIDARKSGRVEPPEGWTGDIPFFVGSIAGYVDGGSIINCTASGNILVGTYGSDCNYVGYVGGLIGGAVAHYEEDVMDVEFSAVGCTSGVEVNCIAGNIFTAGGIVGYMRPMTEKTPAYVADCVNSGNVTGAFRTGGIVGHLSTYTSIINCLSIAEDIEASCTNANVRHAYAGGIVGYADYESLVYGCYSASNTSASSSGAAYQHSGAIAGIAAEASSDYLESHDALVVNSYSKFGTPSTGFTESLLKNTLKWNTENWKLGDSAVYPLYPSVSVSSTGSAVGVKTGFTVTVNYVGNQTVENKSVFTYTTKEYGSMASIYRNGGMYEYLSADNNSMRTYGYFFDEALTQRVPCSFVSTSDITLYAGFADYGSVSGKYYLRREGAEGSGAYFELKKDGTLLFRSGAVYYESTYVYDGVNVLLIYNPAFSETAQDGSYAMYCGIGTITDGVLSVYDNHNYTSELPLNAIHEIEGFAYGTYYAGNTEYQFNGDGTVIKNSSVLYYSVSGDTLTIINGNETETVIIENGKPVSVDGVALSAVDRFAGVWETDMLGTTRYNFDGKGGYTYETFTYANGRKTAVSTGEGTYGLNGDKIVLNTGEEIAVNDNGFIEIDGVEYYRQSSFIGSWRFFAIRTADVVELKLTGIGIDGYGIAEVKFGASREVYTLNYEAVARTTDTGVIEGINLYYMNGLLGTLEFTASDLTLTGSFNGISGCKFCLYDVFRGEWVSEKFGLISFNGLGLYNRLRGSNITNVEGRVLSDGKVVGSYLLTNGTASGTLTVNGENYTIVYNKANDSITVSDGEDTFELIHMDNWVDVTLVDADGKVYTFDGFGNLASGGSVLVNGEEAYKYFNNNDGTLKIVLGTDEGSFTVSGSAYVLEVGNIRKELTLYNVFSGTWQVSGMSDGKIVIGKLGIDNRAHGSFLGQTVEFVYADGVLSFGYNGKTLYVISFSTFGRYKFAISENETTAGGVLNYCVAIGDLDGFEGVYTNKTGGSMMLDGFSNTLESGTAYPGTAFMYNAQGELTAEYEYRTINRVYKGVEITMNDGSKRLLVENSDGEYTLGNKSYNLVTPDELYPGTYYRSYAADIGADNEAIFYYAFDGMGTMMELLSGDTYAYEITGKDETRREIYIALTKKDDGSKYTAVLDYSQSTVVPLLTIQEEGNNA